MLLGLGGKKGVGKSTLADNIIKSDLVVGGCSKRSFATTLKNILAEWLGPYGDPSVFTDPKKKDLLLQYTLENHTVEQLAVIIARHIPASIASTNSILMASKHMVGWLDKHRYLNPRVSVNPNSSDLNQTVFQSVWFITARALMQEFGSEACRGYISKDVWVRQEEFLLERNLVPGLSIYDDVRFPEEVEMIHDHGGVVIEILRDGFDPDMEDHHMSENQKLDFDGHYVLQDSDASATPNVITETFLNSMQDIECLMLDLPYKREL